MRTRIERRGKMGTMMDGMKRLGMAALLMLAVSGSARADDCITQSAMKPADRDALATAARGLAAELRLKVFQGRVELTDRLVTSLSIPGIRKRVSVQASQPSFINNDVSILNEISRGRSAMAPDPI